jgi:hypothetical protein
MVTRRARAAGAAAVYCTISTLKEICEIRVP